MDLTERIEKFESDRPMLYGLLKEQIGTSGIEALFTYLINTLNQQQVKVESDQYNTDIHSNPDAQIWAKYFMECKENGNWAIEDIDEELMFGWFANAMMAMRDHIYQTKTVINKE